MKLSRLLSVALGFSIIILFFVALVFLAGNMPKSDPGVTTVSPGVVRVHEGETLVLMTSTNSFIIRIINKNDKVQVNASYSINTFQDLDMSSGCGSYQAAWFGEIKVCEEEKGSVMVYYNRYTIMRL